MTEIYINFICDRYIQATRNYGAIPVNLENYDRNLNLLKNAGYKYVFFQQQRDFAPNCTPKKIDNFSYTLAEMGNLNISGFGPRYSGDNVLILAKVDDPTSNDRIVLFTNTGEMYTPFKLRIKNLIGG